MKRFRLALLVLAGGAMVALPAAAQGNPPTVGFGGTGPIPSSRIPFGTTPGSVARGDALAAETQLRQLQTTANATAAALAQAAANAAFPAASALSCSGALTLAFPPSGDVAYDVTLTGPCALSVAGATAGHMQTMEITVRQGAVDGWPLTLPSGVHWKYGLQPIPNTVGGTYDEYFIRTKDGGNTLTGSY